MSADCAGGAYVARHFLREAKPVSSSGRLDDVGDYVRGLKAHTPPDRQLLCTAPAVLRLCFSGRHVRGTQKRGGANKNIQRPPDPKGT